MNKTAILISYFANRDEAREALGKLQRKGHRRIACVSKGSTGNVRTLDPFRSQWFWGAVVAIILFAALVEGVSMRHARPALMPGRFPGFLLPVLVGGLIGILINAA